MVSDLVRNGSLTIARAWRFGKAAASAEISRNVHDAAVGTSEVNAHVAGLSQGAKAADATAGQLLDAADELSGQAESTSGEVSRFVANVRAA